MESRLEKTLRSARSRGRKLLVPYLMGGWPDPARFEAVLAAVCEAGADAVEVGLPHTDPVADGPVIQQAGRAALDRGASAERILASAARAAGGGGPPLVLMTYANLVFRPGPRAFCERAAAAGFRGLVVPDLPVEEAAPVDEAARAAGLDRVPLVAPTTPAARAADVVAQARGFVYLVSVTGVTGDRPGARLDVRAMAGRLRRLTDLPLCVGFGVSGPEQASELARQADGVVVGSALLRAAAASGDAAEGAASFVRRLRAALDGCGSETVPGRGARKGGAS